MADIRIKDSEVDEYLSTVGELSDATLARVGVARVTWNAWSPRQKLLKLVQLGMLRIQELNTDGN
jgi:hypothetical protein